VTDPGPPTPPPPPQPSLPAGWSSAAPPPSIPVTEAASSPPAPSRPPRKRWIAVLVAALVGIAAIAIAGTALFVTNTLPPLRATWDFTNDIEDGHYDSAFAQLCEPLRTEGRRTDFENFADLVNDNTHSIGVNIFSVNRNGDHATVEFTAHKPNERDLNVKLTVVHEDGDWKPCGALYRRVAS